MIDEEEYKQSGMESLFDDISIMGGDETVRNGAESGMQ